MTFSSRLLNRIRARGPGSVFAATSFLDVASRSTIDQTLLRLARRGLIRRVARGLYHYPRRSQRLGVLSPRTDAIVKALGAKYGPLQVSPAAAANKLGLTTQVPAKSVYLINGSSRRLSIAGQELLLKHAAPRKLLGAGTRAGDVYQALRFLGPSGVNDSAMRVLKSKLAPNDKIALQKNRSMAPTWLQPVITEIAA